MLIDDDRDVHQSIAVLLRRAGLDFAGATSPDEAYSMLELEPAEVILLDLNFTRGQSQGEEGFAALARLLDDDPEATVVVITGHSGVRIAVAAMRAGAFDFVMKPWRNDELLERIHAAIAHRQRRREIAALVQSQPVTLDTPALLGSSAAMEQIRQLVRRVAPTTSDVLVTGPAGSGRSLIARTIHSGSPRANRAMVVIEATAAADPTDDLARAELARAKSGTVLLRHVDRLDTAGQTRLIARLDPDMRVIATAQSAQTLSPALRARAGTIELAVPSLAVRDDDAVLLARHFLRRAARQHGRPFEGLSLETEVVLKTTPWPDEVRGLEQAIERAVVLGDGGLIGPADLGLKPEGSDEQTLAAQPVMLNLQQSERGLIEAALKRNGFNISHAAEELGLSRAALYRRMAKHGL